MEKRCENCRKLMKLRILPNGNQEYPSYLKKKRFCSLICGGIANVAKRKAARDAEMRA